MRLDVRVMRSDQTCSWAQLMAVVFEEEEEEMRSRSVSARPCRGSQRQGASTSSLSCTHSHAWRHMRAQIRVIALNWMHSHAIFCTRVVGDSVQRGK